VRDGKCGAKRNDTELQIETPENRAAEVSTFFTTLAHASSFQHAKRSHSQISKVSDEEYSANFQKLLKGTFKLSPEKGALPESSLYERATDANRKMTFFGLVASSNDDLSTNYRNLFSKVMNDGQKFNAGNFTPNKEEPLTNEYTGDWNVDSFDKMMTSIKGKESESLDVRCHSVYEYLDEMARPVPAAVLAAVLAAEPATGPAAVPAAVPATGPVTGPPGRQAVVHIDAPSVARPITDWMFFA
jgi:hypothetical protein